MAMSYQEIQNLRYTEGSGDGSLLVAPGGSTEDSVYFKSDKSIDYILASKLELDGVRFLAKGDSISKLREKLGPGPYHLKDGDFVYNIKFYFEGYEEELRGFKLTLDNYLYEDSELMDLSKL